MATEATLTLEIQEQSTLVNRLKSESADPSIYEEARKKLGELKKSLGVLKAAAGGGKDAAKKKERLLLKTAKVCVRCV